MRLDHLLSKEHLAGRRSLSGPEPHPDQDPVPSRGVGPRVRGGARGWNADQFGRRLLPAPSTARRVLVMRRVWNGAGRRTGVVGTLLGPEGTDPWSCRLVAGGVGAVVSVRAAWISHHPVPCGEAGVRWGRVGGDGLVVENCTVDASIFDSL